MSTAANKVKFPDLLVAAKSLADDYERREDNEILLAIYYQPSNPEVELNIFMVINQFFRNEVWLIEELFEVTYRNSPQIPLPDNIEKFRLIITNPVEFPIAMKNRWPTILDIVLAIQRGEYEILINTQDGNAILEQMKKYDRTGSVADTNRI